MISAKLIETLTDIVGSNRISFDRLANEVYSYDASLATGYPEVIVFPADTAETAQVVRAFFQARISFVPRGFGTNLSGGSVSTNGGAIISLARLNRVLDIDLRNRTATVQPGVTNLELQNALALLGYLYAPDPASQKVATLGGNIGENAGGPHCLKYGVTTNHVLGMTVVMPDGEIVTLGGPAMDPPGFDLRGVMVGSEGTLGIVTETMVRILPQPESVVTLLAVYDDISEAAQSVSDIIAACIIPATLEMMDAPVIQAVEDSKPCGYPRDATAVLIIEVDGPKVGLQRQAAHIAAICEKDGCRSVRKAKDAAERDLLWAGRRGAFGAIARITPSYLVTDCTVPRSKLPEALARVARIAKEHNLTHGNVLHAGDGNLHPLLFFDSRGEGQVDRVHKAGWEIMQACVDLGGTISGEHGIGIEKREAMRMVCSEDTLEFQRLLKQAMDPEDLLNPGKIFPPPAEGNGRHEPPARNLAGQQELVPADAAEACDMVRRAFLERVSLLPAGAGTLLDFGNTGAGGETVIRSDELCKVVDYDYNNQVVTVEAGMRLRRLQELLAAHDQWLPVRPPFGNKCTIGGVVALGTCGPDRLRYGAPRDLLLGLRFVSGTGRLISAGGKVMKNVSGYDLTRLLVGSAGTLGFLTELTCRTMPIPEVCRITEANGSLAQCADAAGRLLDSRLEPGFITAAPADPWTLRVGFEGFSDTVASQSDGCEAMLLEAGLEAPTQRRGVPCANLFAEDLANLYAAEFLLRADLPLGCVQDFIARAGDAFASAAMFVDFGCGRLLATKPELDDDAWTLLGTLAKRMDGHILLEKAPAEFKARHDVFGLNRSEWKLIRRVKETLDPHDIFAPGRLPGKEAP